MSVLPETIRWSVNALWKLFAGEKLKCKTSQQIVEIHQTSLAALSTELNNLGNLRSRVSHIINFDYERLQSKMQ